MKQLLTVFTFLVIALLFNTCNRPLLTATSNIGLHIQEINKLSANGNAQNCILKNFTEFDQSTNRTVVMAYEQSVERCFFADGYERIQSEFHGEEYLIKYTFLKKDNHMFLAHIQDVSVNGTSKYTVYFDENQNPFRFLRDDDEISNEDFRLREVKDENKIEQLRNRLLSDYLKTSENI